MPEETRKKTDIWVVVIYSLLVLAGLAVLGMGLLRFLTNEANVFLLGIGALSVIVTVALYPIATSMSPSEVEGNAAPEPDRIAELLSQINDRLMVSDAAKRIAYREQDRAALRKAIQDEISKHDYEAALALVEEMSSTYGYRLEAEQFRKQIEEAREADLNERIDELIVGLDELIKQQRWEKAFREAAAIKRMFPDSQRTMGLTKRVKFAFDQHKHDLERQFLEAAGRDDVETAMELLREMDKYLTEEEAAPFRETARGVISKKRRNLGVQFKLAVHDREWTQAVQVGEEVIAEFPNSQMADEVRGMLDVLRERAAGQRAAQAGGGQPEGVGLVG